MKSTRAAETRTQVVSMACILLPNLVSWIERVRDSGSLVRETSA